MSGALEYRDLGSRWQLVLANDALVRLIGESFTRY